jgi:hypothetical protein
VLFTGGIGGYGGGNLGAGLKNFGTEQAMQQATAGGVAPQATLGQGITAAVSKPMDFLKSMGGGDML